MKINLNREEAIINLPKETKYLTEELFKLKSSAKYTNFDVNFEFRFMMRVERSFIKNDLIVNEQLSDNIFDRIAGLSLCAFLPNGIIKKIILKEMPFIFMDKFK